MCEDECVECDSNAHPLPTAIVNLCELLEKLHDLTDWKRLGLALGLLYPTLNKIEKDFDKSDECKMEIMAALLQLRDNVLQKGVPIVISTASCFEEHGGEPAC